MRKMMIAAGLFLFAGSVMAQAVKDRNIVPLAVNLNQVLRLTITDGGNIEFVFNSIDDYRNGISADAALATAAQDADQGGAANNPASSEAMYVTSFTVASSTKWKLDFGSEQAALEGTDNPANTLDLTNVGFTLTEDGTHDFGTELDAPGVDAATGTEPYALPLFSPGVTDPLIQDNGNALANSGDVTDNSFSIRWRVGTTESVVATAGSYSAMNALTLLSQGDITPDRYVTNVLFELGIDF